MPVWDDDEVYYTAAEHTVVVSLTQSEMDKLTWMAGKLGDGCVIRDAIRLLYENLRQANGTAR